MNLDQIRKTAREEITKIQKSGEFVVVDPKDAEALVNIMLRLCSCLETADAIIEGKVLFSKAAWNDEKRKLGLKWN